MSSNKRGLFRNITKRRLAETRETGSKRVVRTEKILESRTIAKPGEVGWVRYRNGGSSLSKNDWKTVLRAWSNRSWPQWEVVSQKELREKKPKYCAE